MDKALVLAQQEIINNLRSVRDHKLLSLKNDCHVRIMIYGDPEDNQHLFRSRVPTCFDVGKLVFFRGIGIIHITKSFEPELLSC